MMRSSLLTALSCALVMSAEANNIQVTNATLTGNTGSAAMVQFDLSWENSWRGGGVSNWDAAWVFVKYRSTGSAEWRHMELNNTGHVAPSGSQIDLGLFTPGVVYNALTNPVIGVFIFRDMAGDGTLLLPAVGLNWNYATLGLAYNDIAEVEIFALEMVHVPQGTFLLGSGGSESGSFTDGAWDSGTTIPLMINSEAALVISPSAGALWGTSTSGLNTIGGSGTLPAAYPKGFRAMYCMKYEVTQQGYVDFLNTLTYSQQLRRTTISPSAPVGTRALFDYLPVPHRAGIVIQVSGVEGVSPARYVCNGDEDGDLGEAGDGQDVACPYLGWGDLTAYLDWCGLRPMTELEYEKSCRGPLPAVANEYPWGNTTVASAPHTLSNAGYTNEGIASGYSGQGNAAYGATNLGTLNAPLRVGIFSANPGNTGRSTSGATYYGIMEMGGNLWERTVAVGILSGRGYTGTHGDGELSLTGDPNNASWPSPITAIGAGWRGSSWENGELPMRVSDRDYAGYTSSGRSYGGGGRGVRTAP
jgi:formylglycine-generating enzyme required for sulfatase activity